MGNWRAKVIISVLGGTTESFRLSTHLQEPVSLLWPQYKAGCDSLPFIKVTGTGWLIFSNKSSLLERKPQVPSCMSFEFPDYSLAQKQEGAVYKVSSN